METNFVSLYSAAMTACLGVCVVISYLRAIWQLQIVTTFLDEISALSDEDQIDLALDRIYDYFENAVSNGRFDVCNDVLRLIDCSEVDLDISIGIATATLPIRSHLSCRPSFMLRLRRRLREQYDEETVNRHLIGLH